MKYAVISDIHGNAPALRAVLEDAARRGAEGFLLLGDYCLSNPFPNECTEIIRHLPQALAVAGNEEGRLTQLRHRDQSGWTDGQMQVSYWCCRVMTPENMDYLETLPQRIHTVLDGVPVHMAHSSAEFIGDCEHRQWDAASVALRYGDAFVPSARRREEIRRYLDGDEAFQRVFASLEDGVYLFGHSHVQWSYASPDGKKLLLNPGSCGLPLDCTDEGVPYTLLDMGKKGVTITEVRLPMDRGEMIRLLRNSDQYAAAPVWSEVIIKELKKCREQITFFLQHTEAYAKGIKDPVRPYSVKTWEDSFRLWNTSQD
jgi:predicted phosphodiesterase